MRHDEFVSILRKNPRRLEGRRLVTHLCIDLSLWGLIYLIRHTGGWWLIESLTAAWLFAFFCFRSFGLMHDAVHGAAAEDPRLNDMIGEVMGVMSFLPYRSWRNLHLDHHKWTGNVEKDPSMKLLAKYDEAGGLPRWTSWAWRNWIPVLGFMQHLVFWRATVSRGEYLFLIGETIYMSVLTWALGPFSLLAGVLFYLYLVEIVNFPHHLGLRQFKGEGRVRVYEQEPFVRSCIYHPLFAHLVLLNFNLHTEHHLYPSHPWYQLDAIHDDLLRAEVKFNQRSGNSWILENRRRPVEDVFAETFAGQSKKVA